MSFLSGLKNLRPPRLTKKNRRFRSIGRPRLNLQQETLRALTTASPEQRKTLVSRGTTIRAVPWGSMDLAGHFSPQGIRISSPELRKSRASVQGLIRHELGHAIIEPVVPVQRKTDVHHDVLRSVGLGVTSKSTSQAASGQLRDITRERIRRFRRDK